MKQHHNRLGPSTGAVVARRGDAVAIPVLTWPSFSGILLFFGFALLSSSILLLPSPSLVQSSPGGSDPNSPRLLIDPSGPAGKVWELLFTPDGATLISLGEDKAIRFWDVESGQLRRTLRLQIGDGHEGKFAAGALSPEGRWLAVGGRDSELRVDHPTSIRVIDLDRGEVAAVLSGHFNAILALAFSDDGRWLASGSTDKTVRVWDVGDTVKGGQGDQVISESQVLEGHTADIYAVSFAPGGERLVSGSYDHTLTLWERSGIGDDFERTATLERHTAEVGDAAFSPDGRFLVSGGKDHQLLLWDGESGAFLRALEADMGYDARAIAFSPDSRRVLASSAPGSVGGYTAIYALPTGERLTKFTEHSNSVAASAWNPDPKRNLVASAGGDDNDIYLWNPDSGEIVHHLRGEGRAGWAVAFAKQGGLKVAFGHERRGYQLGGEGAALERTFDFASFTLADLDPTAGEAETAFRRTIPKRGNATLKRTDKFHLQTGAGEIALDPKRYARIRAYSFTPGGEVVVGSSFSLKLHQPGGAEVREFIGHEGVVLAVSPSPDGRYLASASYDQTVRLWNLQTGALLASLFVGRDGEWVCWTPSGHYHASSGGERYIGWHFNRGLDKMGEFFPSYVFRDQFHYPELVKRTVLLGDFERALAETGAKPANVAASRPPRVDWVLPARRSSQARGTEEITVRARITSPNAELVEVKLLLNDKAVESDSRVAGRELTFERTIRLLPGENRLAVFARNTHSGHTSDLRVVTVASAPAASIAARRTSIPGLADAFRALPAEDKTKLYVLSVGISTYADEELTLHHCDADAVAVAEAFEAQEGTLFREVETKVITNTGATRGAILNGLKWLSQNATQNDMVVVFLAAHGRNDDTGSYYLIPTEGSDEDLLGTGVEEHHFVRILGNIPAKTLAFLDTCHSGRLARQLIAGRTRDGKVASPADPAEMIRLLQSPENGVMVLSATTGRELSAEIDKLGHGAFTYAILEGLKKPAADTNRNGVIEIRELNRYVADRVKELTKGAQHPISPDSGTLNLPLAVLK